MKVFTGKMPDVTPGQIGALLTFAVGQLVAWQWVTNDQAQTLISSGSIIVAAVWKIADAYLRGQRARALAPVTPTPPAPPVA